MTRSLLWCPVLALASLASLCGPGLAIEPSPDSRAVLVGCTVYDHNPARSLKGPANDVSLLSDLLIEQFGFPKGNIRRLTEGPDSDGRPTRANIVREIGQLIAGARAGQRVVLFFAGHGSQQPDQVPGDPLDPELDGLDEVFLPADIGVWESETKTVRNAIVDDEFRLWSEQLLAKGVELLVIFDSCHSGSGMRDVGDLQLRQIEPDELIPRAVLDATRERSAATDRGSASVPAEPPFDGLAKGRWTALYAAQPEQPTFELRLPRNEPDAPRHGLFTYVLCQTLRAGDVPSYRELIQRVRGQYLGMGKASPTPMIEGSDLDRGVLGAPRGRASHLLEKARGRWFVRAGQLHGITEGSILAVRPPQSAADAPPEGHVLVVDAGLDESTVRPCAFRDDPVPDKLPTGGLCRTVYVDYGEMRLPIALDAGLRDDASTGTMLRTLRTIAGFEDSPMTLVERPEAAEWVIMREPAGRQGERGERGERQWVLTSRGADLQTRGAAESLPTTHPLDEETEPLADTLRRVARATNLLALSSRFGNQGGEEGEGGEREMQIELEALYSPSGGKGARAPLSIERLPTVVADGKLQFRVTNRGRQAVDFTLLFVDSAFGIEAVFPQTYAADNRLPAGKSWESRPMRITAETTGREHALLIAVPATASAPINFTFLTQPRLEGIGSRGEGDEATPFERLLRSAAQGGGVRGIETPRTPPVITARSWMVRTP